MKKFRLSFYIGLSCLALLLAMAQFDSIQASEKTEKIRVLIKSENPNKEKELKAKHGVRHQFGTKGFTTSVTPQQLTTLERLDHVEVSKVKTISIHNPDNGKASPKNGNRKSTPSDQTPWGIEAIYNDESISVTTGGEGVNVAVLDTGTYTSHPDLVNNVEQCKDFTKRSSALTVGSCDDRNGHGTHVAGTVLGNGGTDGLGVYGVAPNADLWAYKVLGNSGSGYADDIAYAIEHAADQGNQLNENVVISMSLGSSSESPLITDAVNYAVNQGALVVAAAGNSGPDAGTIGYPGATPNAIAVAALENSRNNGEYGVDSYSSRGLYGGAGDFSIEEGDVEVSAPGTAIESTWNNGGYNTISGTSMATPHISGLAAKMWATNPSLSNTQLRANLQSNAKENDITLGSSAGVGDDIASGFGFPLVQ
ncbi:S8 family peptidase [Salinibacillus xinjiangensis]|uniref:S8 family serine peptidase n=1 Tax=Salinibacillus xinjiangensis TaxID=1229268 RepID=A0A6G1X949_9BACI|nr:S8 family serine peptidase [Salinibacillus xinjiangensis]MRG87459.1 S8 family serine peptidase [Salinibacillus xinjiangensis]